MISDDLAPLLAQSGALPDLGFHTGEVLAWDPQTGNNTVRVLGRPLENLSTLNLTETLTMDEGAVVGILRFKSTFFILGRVTHPNTPQFFSGAMPNMPAPFYPMNGDAALQTNSVGGYYVKMLGGYVINHASVSFAVGAIVSGGTATGAYKVQWFPTSPGNGADPTGGTTMAQKTGLTSAGAGSFDEYTYTWPAGMRGQLVYIGIMPSLTAGAGGDWVQAIPRYFIGNN